MLDGPDHRVVLRVARVEEHLQAQLARLRPRELRDVALLAALLGVAAPLRRLAQREVLRVELERDPAAGRAGLQALAVHRRVAQLEEGVLDLGCAPAPAGPALAAANASGADIDGLPCVERYDVNPWWAISTVSVATFADSVLSDGPVHRTGTTESRLHSATTVPSARIARMEPVFSGRTPADHRRSSWRTTSRPARCPWSAAASA